MQPADPDFEFGRRLGKGGNAEVWEAFYRPLHKETAVKIVSLDSSAHAEINAECRMLEQLDSKYIIKYYAALNKKTDIWVVTELCAAGSARDVINKCGPFPELQAVVVLKQLLKALEFIHSRQPPIAHRDIKAGNILLNHSGRMKLGDFGIATHDTGHLHTQIGSPYWLPPEMLPSPSDTGTSPPPVYDHRIDIWALGITAIELVQGKPPYMHLSPMQALFHMATAKAPPTLDEPQQFSANYNAFIAECLHRDPTKRPSAANLRQHPLITGAGSRTLLEVYLENRYRFKRTEVTWTTLLASTKDVSAARAAASGARPRSQAAPAGGFASDSDDEDDRVVRISPPLAKGAPAPTAQASTTQLPAYPFLSSTPYPVQLCRPPAEQVPYSEIVKSKKQKEKEAKEKEREVQREKDRQKEREQKRSVIRGLKEPPLQGYKGPLLDLVAFDVTTGVPRSVLNATTPPPSPRPVKLSAGAQSAQSQPAGPTQQHAPAPAAATPAVAQRPTPDTRKPLMRSTDMQPLNMTLATPSLTLAATRSVSPRPSALSPPRVPPVSSLGSGSAPLMAVPTRAPAQPPSPRSTSPGVRAPAPSTSPPLPIASATAFTVLVHGSTPPPASASVSIPASFVTALPSSGRPFRSASPATRRAELSSSAGTATASSSPPSKTSSSSPSGSGIGTPLRASSGAPRWADWPTFMAQTGLPEADCRRYAVLFVEQMVELEQIPHLTEPVLKRLIAPAHIAPILRLAQSGSKP